MPNIPLSITQTAKTEGCDCLDMHAGLVDGILESLRIGVGFLWTAAWAIIMGLTITSLVQVYVSKERMAQILGKGDISGLTKATAFGAASSGCSFGAVAIQSRIRPFRGQHSASRSESPTHNSGSNTRQSPKPSCLDR